MKSKIKLTFAPGWKLSPIRKIIGDLTDREKVLSELEICV